MWQRETSIGGGERAFPTTRWSLVQAVQAAPAQRPAMLEELLQAYWRPLYHHARHCGLDVEDAKDAVQGFLADFLERGVVDQIDPQRGRLRSLLRVALRNYINRDRQRRQAQKRGGGMPDQPLPADLTGEVADDPAQSFDRAWAQEVFDRAREQLAAEFETGRRRGPLDVFQTYFTEGKIDYPAAARRHDMTIAGLKSFLHRTRKRYRMLILDEIGATVGTEVDSEAELNYFLRLMQR